VAEAPDWLQRWSQVAAVSDWLPPRATSIMVRSGQRSTQRPEIRLQSEPPAISTVVHRGLQKESG